MAHIFKFSVLVAIPDPLRGERVNIGIIVFRPERIDVRFAELSKLKALAGGDWESYAKGLRRALEERFVSPQAAESAVASHAQIDPIIQATDMGFMSINAPEEYEPRINDILENLVIRPKEDTSATKSTRINTEIAKQLKRVHLLAKREETIDAHKVVRDYFIEEELLADFALKNGAMHVTATLDLRRSSVSIKEAALKAIVLHRAGKIYENNVHLIGVYALEQDSKQFKEHISLLREYSNDIYNWSAQDQKMAFINRISSLAASEGPLI